MQTGATVAAYFVPRKMKPAMARVACALIRILLALLPTALRAASPAQFFLPAPYLAVMAFQSIPLLQLRTPPAMHTMRSGRRPGPRKGAAAMLCWG